jgi:hypothetical protein
MWECVPFMEATGLSDSDVEMVVRIFNGRDMTKFMEAIQKRLPPMILTPYYSQDKTRDEINIYSHSCERFG